jgi:hypothetical protein
LRWQTYRPAQLSYDCGSKRDRASADLQSEIDYHCLLI